MELTQDSVYQTLSTYHQEINECAREIFDEIRAKFIKANDKADYTDFNTKSLDDKLCISLKVTSVKCKGDEIKREMIAQRVLTLLQTLGDGKHPFEFYYTWNWFPNHTEFVFYAYIDTHGRSIKSLYEECKKDGTSKCSFDCPVESSKKGDTSECPESDKKNDTSIFKHLSPSALEEVILSKQDEETKANIEAAASICQTIDSVFKSKRYTAEDGSVRFHIQHYKRSDLENSSTIARLVQRQLKRLLPEPTWDVEHYNWVQDGDILDFMFEIKYNYVITEGK